MPIRVDMPLSGQAAIEDADAAHAARLAAEASAMNASTSETAALTSKNNAATYEGQALISKDNSATYEGQALLSKNNAATYEGQALISKDNAATYEGQALLSKNNAALSESNAALSEAAALASKNSAQTSATNATAYESQALTSKDNAATYEGQALLSKNNAATSETAALTSKNNAATYEGQALTSKNNAATYEGQALTSKNNAATYEGQALTSATNASSSATSAQTSATTAANAVAGMAVAADDSFATGGQVSKGNDIRLGLPGGVYRAASSSMTGTLPAQSGDYTVVAVLDTIPSSLTAVLVGSGSGDTVTISVSKTSVRLGTGATNTDSATLSSVDRCSIAVVRTGLRAFVVRRNGVDVVTFTHSADTSTSLPMPTTSPANAHVLISHEYNSATMTAAETAATARGELPQSKVAALIERFAADAIVGTFWFGQRRHRLILGAGATALRPSMVNRAIEQFTRSTRDVFLRTPTHATSGAGALAGADYLYAPTAVAGYAHTRRLIAGNNTGGPFTQGMDWRKRTVVGGDFITQITTSSIRLYFGLGKSSTATEIGDPTDSFVGFRQVNGGALALVVHNGTTLTATTSTFTPAASGCFTAWVVSYGDGSAELIVNGASVAYTATGAPNANDGSSNRNAVTIEAENTLGSDISAGRFFTYSNLRVELNNL